MSSDGMAARPGFSGIALGLFATFVVAADSPTVPIVSFAVAPPVVARTISPDIYGMAATPLRLLTNACVPLNRWGGNPTCRYNWKLGNAWNTGNDWYFENVAIETDAWRGFLRRAEVSGGRAIVTLPLVGFVAKDTASHSFSVAKYGPQEKTDRHRPDAGNGRHPGGKPITGNDRSETSIVADPPFVAAWVERMTNEFPRLFAERRVLFALGNEPMLWNVTHRDVHPEPVSCDEYLARFTAMARAVRRAAPDAWILGPELWGWPAMFQSALDRDTKTNGDRARHGGEDFLPWFLKQVRAIEAREGVRLLDVATVHFYPQAEGVYSASAEPGPFALRLESTRSLWDPAYTDPSWIAQRVELIPRLRRWVQQAAPGLKIGITEYNWGGENDMSGALALADVLGIFGREGLDLACYWTYPPEGSPAALAYAMYRNVDGAGACFGDRVLDVTCLGSVEAAAVVSVYAARDSASRTVTLVVVNRSALTRRVGIAFKGIDVEQGTAYSLQGSAEEIERRSSPLPPWGNGVLLDMAPRSLCHLRFPPRP